MDARSAPVAGKLATGAIRPQRNRDRRDWDGRIGTSGGHVVILGSRPGIQDDYRTMNCRVAGVIEAD